MNEITIFASDFHNDHPSKCVLFFMGKSDSTRPGPALFNCALSEFTIALAASKILDRGQEATMTQNQIGSTERRLALNVCYGIIGTVGIAILCRDLGVGRSVLPWVLYAIFAIPMIVMLSHRELFGALPSNRGILYAMIAVPAIYLLSRQTGFGG
jgi:hypothetical protein